jgi:hypothetical protein
VMRRRPREGVEFFPLHARAERQTLNRTPPAWRPLPAPALPFEAAPVRSRGWLKRDHHRPEPPGRPRRRFADSLRPPEIRWSVARFPSFPRAGARGTVPALLLRGRKVVRLVVNRALPKQDEARCPPPVPSGVRTARPRRPAPAHGDAGARATAGRARLRIEEIPIYLRPIPAWVPRLW